ncbi:hypothetical protein BgiBS90_036491 [Biomphalaria glabrata]|nr:hypothetical protein BgiBS90_036491 [Biomphalaria glabrata]
MVSHSWSATLGQPHGQPLLVSPMVSHSWSATLGQPHGQPLLVSPMVSHSWSAPWSATLGQPHGQPLLVSHSCVKKEKKLKSRNGKFPKTGQTTTPFNRFPATCPRESHPLALWGRVNCSPW